jgi:hypothetical protein
MKSNTAILLALLVVLVIVAIYWGHSHGWMKQMGAYEGLAARPRPADIAAHNPHAQLSGAALAAHNPYTFLHQQLDKKRGRTPSPTITRQPRMRRS